jgi:cell division protein FtsB
MRALKQNPDQSGYPEKIPSSEAPASPERLEAGSPQIAVRTNAWNAQPFPDQIDADVALCQAPAYQQRSFGSKLLDPNQADSRKLRMFDFMITKARSFRGRMRSDYSQDIHGAETERGSREAIRAALALISLIAIVACVGAAIALTQIRSLKSEIAALHREFEPLKDRIAQLEQAEKIRRQTEQQQSAKDEAAIEKSVRSGETQAAWNLSTEEAQLVREYIKPAPSAGAPANTVKVGDVADGAMIPLPSPLTEKVPKLLGARFTIRNGAIIIVRKDSRQVDAVVAPN